MSSLDDFLALDDVKDISQTVQERISGKVFDFKIRPLTADEHKEFQKRAYSIGAKGKVSFDVMKYKMLEVLNCVIEPDFSKADFLQKAGCNTAEEFYEKKIPAGVIADLSEKIETLSGFEAYQEEVDEAKN